MSAATSFSSARRRMAVSAADVAHIGTLAPGQPVPALVQPKATIKPIEWAGLNAPMIESLLDRAGVVLFRGFDLPDAASFRAFAAALSPQLMDYRERAAPRKEKLANVYSSTEFPPQYPIPMHHELAYAHQWPMKIWFYCDHPSPEGGATPVADDRLFLAALDPAIRRQFEEKGVMYVRTYSQGLDMPWQEAFQTSDRAEVERYCQDAGLESRWLGEYGLQTIRRTPAMRVHPRTGQPLWFNHAHLFHISNVEPELREALIARLSPDEYPRNAFYGDGSPIDDGVLDEIRETYARVAVRFPWQRGDVMLIDNMSFTHGRDPFAGPRTILVAMTDPVFARDLH